MEMHFKPALPALPHRETQEEFGIMAKIDCSKIFRAAIKDRRDKYPFDRISAYKVRESRDNLQHNLKTVGSIAEYLRARPRDRHSSMLVGCAEDDKAYRLKQVPEIIARELGYNLIPAIEALTVEGVPAADVTKYMRAILPDINRLINECDAIQKATARAIKFEYEAMKASRLGMERICAAALRIAEDSVKFCDQHGV